MVNIFNDVRMQVESIIADLGKEGFLPQEISLEGLDIVPPREAEHGDVATNAAMILAGKAGKKPREIAEKLVERIQALPSVSAVEIAGPGFINIRFMPEFWQRIIPYILKEGVNYGDSMLGKGVKVDVEYVSANPTGPLHVGHARGAVYGDVLARLLQKSGFNVTKEYYINDAGAQIDKLADSAFLRYREALGETIGEVPEGLYPGEYLKDTGAALAAKFGKELLQQDRAQWLPRVRLFTVEAMLALIKEDLASLGIHHDIFVSERALTEAGRVEEALEVLDKKGLIYVGVLEPPKGKAPEDWEARPQTLFKATQFGDDVDRAIKKSDGSWTYFAPDIALHYDKFRRGHTMMINVFGADHGGYVKRIKAAVYALTDRKVEIDIKLCQLVKFLRGGQPAKMSKRAGTFVTAREVVDEVGKDVFRFIMLTRKNDAPLDFDFEKVTEQSRDNPVFYVQYAHARTRSLQRLAAQEAPEALKLSEQPTNALAALLSHPAELEVIKLLAGWPRMVEAAAQAHESHRIAFYLQEVAAAFHSLWNMGNQEINLRFIVKNDINITAARVMLARAIATVIASGLNVLGVEPVEEMR